MKLLFVTHWANNMLIFRTWMLQEAVRRGHDVYVLCPPDREAAKFAELGVKHLPWTLCRGGGVLNLLSAVADARRTLRLIKPERTVVYCVQPIMALLWAWKLGGRSGRLYPTFTGLGSLWTDLEPASWKKRLVRGVVERVFGALLPQSETVFVLNRDDKAQVAGWNPCQLVAIPGVLGKDDFAIHKTSEKQTPVIQTLGEGVDLQKFAPPTAETREAARARWGFAPDVKVVGFVGRLIREKGAQDFLQLCKELSQAGGYAFLVVGDPDPGNPTSLTAQEMIELERVPNLVREPWMDDVRPAYAAMDVLVFLSAREGLPVTPQEAMAMGVPVVAYDGVGTREIEGIERFYTLSDLQRSVSIDCSSLLDHRLLVLDSYKLFENLLNCLEMQRK